MPNKDSPYKERAAAPRVDEIACKEWYESENCIIERYGWDLLHRKDLPGKFFYNMPNFIADTPDFTACTSDYKLYMLVEAKCITYNGMCNAMKVTHWEAYEKWFKLTKEMVDFYFFFYNKTYGSLNAPFEAVKKIIDNDSEIDYLDKGKFNEKEIHRFSVRGLEEHNVKRW